MIDQVIQPSVLIDGQHNILHLSENVGKFLLPGSGVPSINLLDNVQSGLRAELRTAIYQATHSGKPVKTRSVVVRRGDTRLLVEMTVQFFAESVDVLPLTLVVFNELPEPPPDPVFESTD